MAGKDGGLRTKDEGQGTQDASSLTTAELQPVVTAAIARWAAAGLSTEQLAALAAVPIRVEDLGPQGHLGETTPERIWIDDNGAGYGWFIDATPWNDAEFPVAAGRTELVAAAGGPAADRMDLLTVVMHELGHVLDLGDLDPQTQPGALMAGQFAPGLRRLPEAVGQWAVGNGQAPVGSGQTAGAEGLTVSPGHPGHLVTHLRGRGVCGVGSAGGACGTRGAAGGARPAGRFQSSQGDQHG